MVKNNLNAQIDLTNDRNSGLDIFRILCCIGVLNYHVFDDILGIGSWGGVILYYISSYCVSGFFILSGFLFSKKEALTFEYIENKIKTLVLKMCGWMLLLVALSLVKSSQVLDFPREVLSGAIMGGKLPVTWFLFTYMFLLVLAYPLYRIYKKTPRIFCIATFLLLFLISCGMSKNLMQTKIQTFWLPLYGGYFALGMALNYILQYLKNFDGFKSKNDKKIFNQILLWVLIIFFVVSSFVYANEIITQRKSPHEYYSKWYYMIWLTCIFLFVQYIRVKNKTVYTILKRVASNTFTVYLAHLPILLLVTKRYPLNNFLDAVLMVIFLFITTNIIAEVFRLLPLLRKIV